MARRKRKSRRRGLGNCPCGVAGLGMETPAGYLTVQGKPQPMLAPASSGARGLLVKAAIVAAAAGAGWFGWQWWQKRQGPRQMTEAEAAAGGV